MDDVFTVVTCDQLVAPGRCDCTTTVAPATGTPFHARTPLARVDDLYFTPAPTDIVTFDCLTWTHEGAVEVLPNESYVATRYE